ncbi:MAG: hypothetical protein J6V53_03760 [Alphaproteobacteria bacterium]|nr:hypothetical protein [Alphaproteobacteria bacterium]
MLNRLSVDDNIKFCEDLFLKTEDPVKKLFLMRMALLETCGWIEECLDEIYSYNPKNKPITDYKIMEEHIKKLYSFEYDKMMKSISLSIGVFNATSLEEKLKERFPEQYAKFKGSLGCLLRFRNEYAHKNTEACTNSSMGFSSLRDHLKNIHLGLRALDYSVKKIHQIPVS